MQRCQIRPSAVERSNFEIFQIFLKISIFRVYTASMSLLDAIFTFWPNLAKCYDDDDDDDDASQKRTLPRHIRAFFECDGSQTELFFLIPA